MLEENKPTLSNEGDKKKQIIQPTPQRNFNLDNLKFMQMEVKFYSENNHMSSGASGKKVPIPRTGSYRAPNAGKRNRRKELLEKRRKKYGLTFQISQEPGTIGSGIKEEDADKEEDFEEKTNNDTRDSSKGNNSKDVGMMNEEGQEDARSISRCSNPVSQMLENNLDMNFEDSLSQRAEDEKMSDDSFEI